MITMKMLIFIAPNDYKEETLEKLKLIFGKRDVKYAVSSYSKKECIGYHGAVCMPDVNTNTVSSNDYDGFVIVDGKGIDSYKLYDFRPLLDLILKFNASKKQVCAIGNSVKVLARANIIKDMKISTPDEEEAKRLVLLFHGIPTQEAYEINENISTIRDSGNMDSAIIEILSRAGAK
ncbi:intracellular protease, PfpI family [mine drainage metagenome]|uniref:Intracellular protease, PfpI family n=1 Tax=mine drainage metagenome TaxID=410659 RepID=T1CFL9_9ZZZZ